MLLAQDFMQREAVEFIAKSIRAKSRMKKGFTGQYAMGTVANIQELLPLHISAFSWLRTG